MHDDIQHTLEQVVELLHKQAVEQNIVHHQTGPRQDVVVDLVNRQQRVKLQAKLSHLHPADMARILELLPLDQRMQVWGHLQETHAADVLMELGDEVRRQVIDAGAEAHLRKVVGQLDGDELNFLVDVIPRKLLDDRLETLSNEDRAWVRANRDFPADAVGSLMGSDMVRVREDQSLMQVLEHLRLLKGFPQQCDKLFVVNNIGQLVGVLRLEKILLSAPELRASQVMDERPVLFRPEEHAAEAAGAFDRYDLVSAPVVDERGKLIGRLTVEAVMEYMRGPGADFGLKHAGLQGQEDLFAPIWDSARNRWAWISLSLGTAFIASRVIGMFEATIHQIVALAALMPIVAAIGGNTGNQTAALLVRGLALGRITDANVGYLVRKELALSLLNGVVWGTVVGLFALIFYQQLALAAVIALAMVLTLLVAAFLGVSIPLSLHWLKQDPALGASVLVTAITDSLGFFIFLALASMMLL